MRLLNSIGTIRTSRINFSFLRALTLYYVGIDDHLLWLYHSIAEASLRDPSSIVLYSKHSRLEFSKECSRNDKEDKMIRNYRIIP